MKIKHFTNSFMQVQVGSTKIFTDPWSGFANYGGWCSSPTYSNRDLEKAFDNITGLYISHLHSDHFHPETLNLIENKNVPIFIKNFKSKRLLKKIIDNGFSNIIEMSEWKKYKHNDLYLVCIPQIETNSANIENKLDYDLDTSLLAYDSSNDILFFHKVDNPLSINSLKKIKFFCEKEFGKIPDVSTITCGAASEWPQCFPQLDRKKAKEEFLNKALEEFSIKVDALGSKYIVPGGGRYLISGRYAGLNNFLAIPTVSQMKKHLPKGVKILDIEGGGQVDLSTNSINVKNSTLDLLNDNKISQLLNNPYDYDNYDKPIDDKKYSDAVSRWMSRLSKIDLQPECSISFHLYDKIEIDIKGNPLNVREGGGNRILDLVKKNDLEAHLEIHIEEKALSAVINQNFILKQVMSGSLTIQYRRPNIFYPSTMFALAFFGS